MVLLKGGVEAGLEVDVEAAGEGGEDEDELAVAGFVDAPDGYASRALHAIEALIDTAPMPPRTATQSNSR